jgi:hypothetical protein
MSSSKAISPMIAVVLIISFVVFIGVIIMLFFSGIIKIQTRLVEEQAEKPANSSMPCYYTDLKIVDVVAAHPDVELFVTENGMNALTGLTALIIMNDTSQVEQYYAQTLAAGEIKKFTVNNVDKPFIRIRFYGNACPSYYIEKEYTYKENSESGQVGSSTEISISNSGDVMVKPSIKITGVE